MILFKKKSLFREITGFLSPVGVRAEIKARVSNVNFLTSYVLHTKKNERNTPSKLEHMIFKEKSCWLIVFGGLLILVGYLMPNPIYT